METDREVHDMETEFATEDYMLHLYVLLFSHNECISQFQVACHHSERKSHAIMT